MTYTTNEVNEALRTLQQKTQVLQDPLSLARTFFEIEPNEGQTTFLIELQVESILGHLLQTCRAGGKTLVAAIAICWAALKYDKFKALILSGSYEQARTFYNYVREFIKMCPPLLQKIEGEPLQSETRFSDGGFIKCLTASEKSTRSPHVDFLIVDEFVLVKPDLIDSAFPTVRASKRAKRIFLTTASQTKAAISIARWYDYWDHKQEYGFRTYQWGVDSCDWISKEDMVFAKKILDPYIYETEYLGLRIGRRGAVYKEQQIETAVNQAIDYTHLKDGDCIAGIDWGVVHPTVVTIVQVQGEHIIVVEVRGESNKDVSWWCEYTLPALQHDFNIKAFYCDASHKFNNLQLQNQDLSVVPVAFSRFKEQMIGEIRRELEYELLKIPSHFSTTIKQLKLYSYNPDTEKPIKLNDDYVDSLMLACWGAIGRSLDKFDLFALESQQREQDRQKRKHKDWWRDLVG